MTETRLKQIRPYLPRALAMLAVVCLMMPSVVGAQGALAPTRGGFAAWSAAIGIELTYLSVALLAMPKNMHWFRWLLAIAAVSSAIFLNTLYDYGNRVPEAFNNGATFVRSFDWLLLMLSLVEAAMLAGTAFLLALLVHFISDEESSRKQATESEQATAQAAPALPEPAVRPEPVQAFARDAQPQPEPQPVEVAADTVRLDEPEQAAEQRVYNCPNCNAILENAGQYGAAKRFGHCKHCKEG